MVKTSPNSHEKGPRYDGSERLLGNGDMDASRISERLNPSEIVGWFVAEAEGTLN